MEHIHTRLLYEVVKAYLGPFKTLMLKLIAKIVNYFREIAPS